MSEKELIFTKILEEVKQKAKEQGNCILEEQIKDAFKEIELDKGQFNLIEDYLKQNKIGVGEAVNLDDYLTADEIEYLDYYLEEMKQLEKLSEGEREAVTLSAMAGDIQAQAKLVEIYLHEVVDIAKLYSGQGVYLEDLIGEGNLALAAGVSMLGCLEHAQEAEGMLAKMIMDGMENFIADSLKENQTDKKVMDRVNDVMDNAKALSELLQRKVTIDELKEEYKLSKAVILDAIRMSGNNIEYIEKE